MGFLKSLIKSEFSDKPEDYFKIYFRWERDGREYGPLGFEDMLTRKWSGPPIEGRFENGTKWREYSYFQNILTVLKISREQITEMTKMGIEQVDSNMSFKDAIKVIQLKNEELREKRVKERKEKEQLPTTKKTIKQLKDLGIEFNENITRVEAKRLISDYKDREYLTEIFSYLKKNKFTFVDQLEIDTVAKSSDASLPTFDQFDELYSTLQSLSDYKIEFNSLNSITKDEMEVFINRLYDAEFEAEDIEEQLKDREIMIGDDEFKVVGKLPKKQLLNIRTDIISRYLSGEWNSDKELMEIVNRHLPQLELRKIDY